MKVFCMDAHVSVVADIKNILSEDIEIVDWCLSGHHWVMNRPLDKPKYINSNNWFHLNQEMIRSFQSEYDSFLSTFDAFFTGHVSAFAMIYEKYNKPIIMMNTCRIDIPFCWSNDMAMRNEFIQCLQRLSQKGLLHAFSNNRADQLYTKRVTGIDTQLIPSLCAYANIQYKPEHPTFLCYDDSFTHPLVTPKPDKFEWSDIGKYRGIVHCPYEVSTMSMFEHFTGGMPMFFPSKSYWKSRNKLQSMSAYWLRTIPDHLADFTNLNVWIENSDVYTTFASPNTFYYDSPEHLVHLLETFSYQPESRMEYQNNIRNTWKRIMHTIISGKYWSQEPKHLCYNRIPLLANVVFDGDYTGSGVKAQHAYPHKSKFTKGDVLFVKTDYLEWFLTNRTIDVPVTLVTGVSDLSPTPSQCERILNNPNIHRWIGCNIPVSHPKITKLLIGVGEPERINGNHDTLVRLHTSRPRWEDKSDELCVPYHGNTHESRRLQPTLPKLPFEDYMQAIGSHKFVICMRGNGLDTHRFSEILLMGSVPVIEHSGLDDLYTQFPCIFVDEHRTQFKWNEDKYNAFLDMFWLRRNE